MDRLRELPPPGRSGRVTLWPEPLLLLLGLLGLLFLLRDIPGLSFAGWAVYPAAALLCGGLWFSYRKSRRAFWAAAGGSLLLAAVGAILFRRGLAVQFRYLGELFLSRSAPVPMDTTGAVLLLFSGAAFLLFFAGTDHRCRWFPALFAAILPLWAVLNGIPVRPLALGPLFLWFCGSWSLWRSGHPPNGKGFSLAVGFAAAALLLAWPLATGFSAQLSQPAYRGEEAVYRLWRSLSGTAADPPIGGEVSRGNRYLTGAVQMEVATSRQPTEALYLRGFSGGDYLDGQWTPADDEALLKEVEEILNWGSWNQMVDGMYRTMYYVVNQNMLWETPPVPITVTIRYSGDKYPNHFAPYYSRLTSDWLTGEDGYTCEFYERKDMRLDWENVPSSFAMQRDWNRSVHNTYAQIVPLAYTGVPREELPGLVRLAEGHPCSGTNAITAFILETLREGASYDQTPGWTPVGKDVVEDFLFEKHSGYCVHYASAATLLYRLYGVPARYAAGYLVPPESFLPGEDGKWTAFVTDEAAHAWVEIFLPDYGWTPVEVTPNSQGEMLADYPGFTGSPSRHPVNESAPPSSLLGAGEPAPSFPTRGEMPTSAARTEPRGQGPLWGYLCICFALLLLTAADARRVENLRRLEGAGCRELFGQLLAAFRFCHLLTGLDGTERDFPRKAAEAVPAIPLADWEKAVRVVSAAAYGPGEADPDGDVLVRGVYQRAVLDLYQRLSWHQRLLFRFGRGFL